MHSKILRFLFLSLVATVTPDTVCAQYTGRGPNHPWRAEAATRIEQHRKADLNVIVKLADGTLLDSCNIEVSMQRHRFNFGTAVDARYFLGDQSLFNSNYADKVKGVFNTAVFENHLKPRAWAGDFGSGFSQQVTQQGLAWLNANNIEVRGHSILWTGETHVSAVDLALLEIENPTQQDLQNLYDSTFSHIADIGSAVEGKVYAWDLLNEPRTSKAIEDKLIGFTPAGEAMITSRTSIRKRWFDAAKTVTTVPLFLNDFSILPGGDATTTYPRTKHREILDDLLAAGTLIEGIGLQSHFKQPADPNDINDPNYRKKLTGIPKLIELLDDFQADYNLPIHITEFDYDTDVSVSANRFMHKDYVRDFMTAMFSHDSVDAFLFWGFWEGKMANPNSALFDLDFEPTLAGNQYLDLVFNQWWTDETGLTDSQGTFSTRGFKGDYLIKVEHNGQIYEFDTVLGDNGLNFEAVIGQAVLLGDVDLNGVVDFSDIPPFIAVLSRGGDQAEADCDENGIVDFLDIPPFIAILVGS